ncbi:MAG: plasmid partitioning protein RepB C-terminal domain-containing protein [Alphaproteobacteria bacterium]|nr:plasmid partitioning protein RepB C-terminal domain-containing protein [Alphaproteobacteria bacterium]
MSKQQASIQMIPINQIHILNPRVRNPKLFEGVVQNIAKVGLKRPITVARRKAKVDGKTYDLVCGQGRLEAFMACGQATIPAIVIAASEEQALIMSLVENVARRKHKPMDLLQGVELLRGQGYDAKAIAAKTGHTSDHIQGVLTLLEHGEERLVSAVETGQMPIMLAINIVQSPQNEQQHLREAYETGELSGHKFMAAKKLVETRQRGGKTFRSGTRGYGGKRDEGYTARELVKTYKREVERKSLITRRAEAVNSQLLFVVEALRCLKLEGHFTTLLRAEGLDTMLKQLANLLSERG